MNRPLATSALALILGAGPALADVTPAEVWQSLRASYEQMGYTVTVGSEDSADDTVTLDDVVLTMSDGDTSNTTLVMPQVVLSAVGDGTVRSVVEGQMTLESRTTLPEDDETIGFAMTMDAPGNETITSGTIEALQHDFVMPTLTMAGQALDTENEVPLTATVTGVTGRQVVTTAADGSSTQTYSGRADAADLQITASGPALAATEGQPAEGTETPPASTETDDFQASFRIADLTVQGDGTLPAGKANFGTNPSEALKAGLAAKGTFGMGATTVTFTASTLGGDGSRTDAEGSFQAASGTLAVDLSSDGLSYEGSMADMATNLTSSDMPFPISYAAVENRFRLVMPVIASDQDQAFALTYVLNGLTLDDAIWQALDPQAALPRDPASLTIDIEGQARLTQDLMDPDFGTTASADPTAPQPMPMSPRSLTIKEVALDAIGASADMSGALTFGDDPSQPVGTINGTFSGINGLLDKLVAMGVVPQEQLMGPRMMMAMFARPVEGNPDQLQTQIEFREGGSIFANGQQIQ